MIGIWFGNAVASQLPEPDCQALPPDASRSRFVREAASATVATTQNRTFTPQPPPPNLRRWFIFANNRFSSPAIRSRSRDGRKADGRLSVDVVSIGAVRSGTVIRRKVRQSADQISEKLSNPVRADKGAAAVGLPGSTSVLPPLSTRAASQYRRSLPRISVSIAQPSTRLKVQWPRYTDQRAGDSRLAEGIFAARSVCGMGRKADCLLTVSGGQVPSLPGRRGHTLVR